MARITNTGGFAGGAATVPVRVPADKPDKPEESNTVQAVVATKPPKKKKKPPKKPARQQPAEYNPLLAPFKTPNEIRAEAAQLAAMGAPSEATLRQQQAAEEQGITGYTTGLSGRLAGLAAESAAQNRALLGGYQARAAQAQAGGESAVAAAGGPAGMAPSGPSEVTANTLAALGAIPQTYAPAAQLTGAGLVGQSRLNLGQALAKRSGQVSSDTARYLQQLQDREVQRAISQGTLSQNQARLGLQQSQAEFGQQMDIAKFGLEQQRTAQGWQRLANQAARDASKGKASAGKGLQSAKNSILTNYDKYIGSVAPTGKFEYTIYYTDNSGALQRVPRTITASNQAEAISQATGMVPSTSAGTLSAEQGNAVLGPPTTQQVIQNVAPILINKGATRAQALKWIQTYLLPRIQVS